MSQSWCSVAAMHHGAAISTAFLALCGFAACAELPDAREAWVCNALVEDNELMLGRDVERVEAKLQAMTEDPYLWFRGTAGLYYREVVLPSNGWLFSGGSEAAASDVQLMGDAHIENIGTYLDEAGTLRAEYNDFDAAGFGAFWLEVWRLATSFVMLDQGGLDAADPATGRIWAGWVAEGYLDAVLDAEAGLPLPAVVDNGRGGRILAELFAKARRKGAERDELADETIVDGGSRKFRFAAYPERQPKNADLLLVPTDGELALAERLYADLSASNPDRTGALLGVARRQGAGVASMPNLRFYLLLDGLTVERDDDLILEVKELLDRPLWLDPRHGDDWVASEQGARVVAAQLALQGAPQTDGWLGAWRDGQMAFRLRNYTDYQTGMDHLDVQEALQGRAALAPDAERLARIAGQLLAFSHMRAPLRTGGSSLATLQRALSGDREAFVAQVQEVASEMGLRTYNDFRRFREEGRAASCVDPWRAR
jgi:uncharacterized protein (DUF2252 family)